LFVYQWYTNSTFFILQLHFGVSFLPADFSEESLQNSLAKHDGSLWNIVNVNGRMVVTPIAPAVIPTETPLQKLVKVSSAGHTTLNLMLILGIHETFLVDFLP